MCTLNNNNAQRIICVSVCIRKRVIHYVESVMWKNDVAQVFALNIGVVQKIRVYAVCTLSYDDVHGIVSGVCQILVRIKCVEVWHHKVCV